MVDVDDDADQDYDELVECMGKLMERQRELEKIDIEERSKIWKVKCKHNEFRRALYNKRDEIIKSISGFWMVAFLSHPVLADKVSEEDEKVFKYMISLQVEDFRDGISGYSITLNFSPNPFFEGTGLTKNYFFFEDGTTNVTCEPIRWKDGMNITSGSVLASKGDKLPITEFSFFNWFEEEILPVDAYDGIATKIRELWANPLIYFCNETDVDDVDEDCSDDDEKKKDDMDYSVSVSNDVDTDHHDKENVNEDDFNLNGSDDANNDNDDEVLAHGETEDRSVVEPSQDDHDEEMAEAKNIDAEHDAVVDYKEDDD